jgi:hypothetical protein
MTTSSPAPQPLPVEGHKVGTQRMKRYQGPPYDLAFCSCGWSKECPDMDVSYEATVAHRNAVRYGICTCPTFNGEQARSFFCPTHGEETQAEQRRAFEQTHSPTPSVESEGEANG